ncbi:MULTISPECIES: DUF4099 domain-containing protein [Bacteroidales]|uniref:DUF4099 domain-containing protein n=1 Tax=Bacteroidales TaxID=171549 RepID=UPI0025A4DCAC|nr:MULTISPECIES: DUF4099 domain-containing protein [Bacteroides]
MDQTPDQQEVLMARDNTSGKVGAVVGQNPDGTPKMADVKSTPLSELIKFNKGQNPLEAFMSNFLRQAKNPTMFSFFRLPADRYEMVAPAMADIIQEAEKNAEMLRPYAVETDVPAQTVKPEQQSVPEPPAQQEQQAVETPQPPQQAQTPEPEQSAQAQQSQQPEQTLAAPVRNAPINADSIDWDKIQKQWGITREDLEKSGALDQMVYNHKSPQLFTVTPQFGDEKFSIQAKLSFRTNPDGSYSLVPHFVRNEPQLDKEYKGYTFTGEDKAELRKIGNLGRAVELADPKTGEIKRCLVSIDRLTNEIESMPIDNIYIRRKVANIELDMQAVGILKNGGTIRAQSVELPNGAKFVADLQYNVSKRDVVFVNSDLYRQLQGQQNSRPQQDQWHNADGTVKRLAHWCKIELSEQQQNDYLAGKKVLVGEAKDKFGNDCTVYFQYDPEKRAPVTTRIYPDRNNVVGIAEESRTQMAVNNDGATNEATKNVKEPLQRGQTAPKDENQQRQQKPKGPRP